MSLHKPTFVGWSKPLAQAVASCLLKDRNGGPIDLGQHRVIVPSSFASRLIQEELAKKASGLLLPEFQTPDKFLNWGDSVSSGQVDTGTRGKGEEQQTSHSGFVAAKETCLLAWVEVLTSPHFSRTDFPALFPVESTPDFTFEEAK